VADLDFPTLMIVKYCHNVATSMAKGIYWLKHFFDELPRANNQTSGSYGQFWFLR